MAKLRSLLSKVGSLLKGRPKAPKLPPRVGMGHRGIAAGSLKERHAKIEAGEQPYTQEEIEKWEPITSDEATDFVYHQLPFLVHSSNVESAQYFIEDQKMLVIFHGGKRYMYSNVSEQEAIAFIQAQSKGGFIWSYFRVRGTRDQHKKPYTRL